MSDATTTIGQLREHAAEFVRERDWEQFHTPKNLSMSIAIEAAELMEHFQWLTVAESRTPPPAALAEIGAELADVVLYALSLANALQLDLSEAVLDKLAANRRKYPSDQVRGKAHKYTFYQRERE